MTTRIQPRDAAELGAALAWAAGEAAPVEVIAAGTKRALGGPVEAGTSLDLSALAGIESYMPTELVLTARAATPIAEIDAALAANGQELAFEPPDYRAVFGLGAGDATGASATIGGIVACNLSGPRRIFAGAARDHFLGVKAVSGRGEAFKSGGKVVKNVTGYDLCKLLAGSFGTLAAMSEITVKVLPAAEEVATLLLFGRDDSAAVAAMSVALSGPFQVSGAAHLPAGIAARSGVAVVAEAGAAVTALRLEGGSRSVEARLAALSKALGGVSSRQRIDGAAARDIWREIGDVQYFAAAGGHGGESELWRLSPPPAEAAGIVAAIAGEIAGEIAVEAFYDWGGGRVWLAVPPPDSSAVSFDAAGAMVRRAVNSQGGHAFLFRAEAARRRSQPAFEPASGPLAALSQRLKASFDPRGILNPGRMSDGV